MVEKSNKGGRPVGVANKHKDSRDLRAYRVLIAQGIDAKQADDILAAFRTQDVL